MDTTNRDTALPARAGVGLKADHYETVLAERPDIGWFEVHAENYMGAGGPAHYYLEKIRSDYPLSIHGVGLSIGSHGPLDTSHLQRLKILVERYQPEIFSEHLAWSSHGGVYFNDLLPLPYTPETVSTVADHIDQLQNALGRRMFLENPSTYVVFEHSTMGEIEFLRAVVDRSGCGLLLDVNNVYVSATNHDYSPTDYLDAFPVELVGEIHLGGHAPDRDDEGRELLIDAHDRAVADRVWALYERVLSRAGRVPTLIEWDTDVPAWPVLFDQARAAEHMMDRLPAGSSRAIAG